MNRAYEGNTMDDSGFTQSVGLWFYLMAGGKMPGANTASPYWRVFSCIACMVTWRDLREIGDRTGSNCWNCGRFGQIGTRGVE